MVTVRSTFSLFVVVSVTMMACSGSSGGGSGCSALSPLPGGGRYAGAKSDNAVNARISSAGISYLNTNWAKLVDMFAPGQVLTIDIPCTKVAVPVIGDVLLADDGSRGCNSTSCGKMDGTCDADDAPHPVAITITAFKLVPKAPDSVEAQVSVSIDTGRIFVDTTNRHHAACGFLTEVKCGLDYDAARQPPSINSMKTTLKFSIDSKWDKQLRFTIGNLVGTEVCGSSGAQAAPYCIDPDDLKFTGENNCGNVYCGVADWSFLKNFVAKLISPMLQDKVQAALDKQECQTCGSGLPACPNIPGASSTCVTADGICKDTASTNCVPRFLGVEGRVGIGSFMTSFGAPADAALDMTLFAGASVKVDTGINLGTRAGMSAVAVAPCVPLLPAPALVPVTPPDFDAAASFGSNYHVGVGLSQSFLNIAMHQVHQSGALCLALNASNVGLLSTTIFKPFLPSLGKLATRDGKDAPMMVVLKPAAAPLVKVGEGTFDPMTKKPVKPLLTLTLPDVTVDIYVMIDDRYARLFSLSFDVALPLSLIFNGCSSVQPAIGDIKSLITNVKTSNSEMLAEDPKVLADLIPAVIGLAEPALATALKPFALPALGPFKLKVTETKGVGAIAGTENYNHLGIYAQLLPSTAACAVSAPAFAVKLLRTELPRASELELRGQPLPYGDVILGVSTTETAAVEYSVRVDNGFWSTFRPAAQGELRVTHGNFWFDGRHVVEVQARFVDDAHGVSAPQAVAVGIDYRAPTVRLDVDRAADRVLVATEDGVTPRAELLFAYRVGLGEWGSFGAERAIALSAIEASGGVAVRVKDLAGNVGEASYRVAKPAAAPVDDVAGAEAQDPGPAAGCTAVPVAFGLPLLLAGAARRRRRS